MMPTKDEKSLKSAFDSISMRGRDVNEADKQYSPASLRNRVTNKRQEVMLVDPHNNQIIESAFLQDLGQDVELHADVKRALEPFSAIEKRVIFRVLVQGQSIEEATKKTRWSSRTWQRRLKYETFPHLRTALRDYEVDLARLGITFLPDIVIDFEEDTEAEVDCDQPLCKRCGIQVNGLNGLRSHWRESHSSEYIAVQSYVHENDHRIARDSEALKD
jgi:hypothetical protein